MTVGTWLEAVLQEQHFLWTAIFDVIECGSTISEDLYMDRRVSWRTGEIFIGTIITFSREWDATLEVVLAKS